MNEPMIWAIVSTVVVLGLTMLVYLLREKFPNLGNAILTLVGLAVASGSLYVSIVTLQKTIEDSKEQQKSLDVSRKLLEAVVETVKNEQEVLTKHLETSRSLLALQKEQQEVFTKSLEISKAQLALQKEERQRVQELANQKPKIQAAIGNQLIVDQTIQITVTVGQNNMAVLPVNVKNIGSAVLLHPFISAFSSRKDISVRLEGGHSDTAQPHRSQLAGRVLDILPFRTSQKVYDTSIHLIVPSSVSDFDIDYDLAGDNLEEPFKVLIHVHVKRE